MGSLDRLRRSLFGQYLSDEAKKKGVTVGLVSHGKVMWVEIPFTLSRPEKIFSVKLQPLTYFRNVQTQLGPVDIPEYTKYPSMNSLRTNVICLLDYFDQKNLPGPSAFIYLSKQGVYVSKHGWLSLYSTNFGIRRAHFLFHVVIIFLNHLARQLS